MKKKLILVGAGEQAEIAYEYFTYDSDFEVHAFAVEREYLKQEALCGKPIVPYEEIAAKYPPSEFYMFIAIPASQLNKLRTRLYLDGKAKGYRFATYISSRAFVWRNAKIGENTFIFENNVIQPFVTIGNNCILWSGNHIGHRSVIKDHTFIASHVVVSGYCEVGEGCFIGVNATINDNIKIADRCLIGSGALIAKDTETERIYVGSPSRAVPGKSSLEAEM